MIILSVYLYLCVFYFGFLAYASLMNKGGWSKLSIEGKLATWWLWLLFGAVDVFFNLTFGSLIFLQLPVITKDWKSWTLSYRLWVLVSSGAVGWRKTLATKIVSRDLSPFTKDY